LSTRIRSLSKQMGELTWELESLFHEFEKFKKEVMEESESKSTFVEQERLQEFLRISELKNSIDRPLRLKEVLEIVPVKKSKWWDGVKSGLFPKPEYPLGPKTPTWRISSILRLVNQEEAHNGK